MLIAMLDNATSDEFFVTRRHMMNDKGIGEQWIQCATVQKPADGEKHDYFVTKVMEE